MLSVFLQSQATKPAPAGPEIAGITKWLTCFLFLLVSLLLTDTTVNKYSVINYLHMCKHIFDSAYILWLCAYAYEGLCLYLYQCIQSLMHV